MGYHFRRREPEEDNAIPSVHIDYMYMKSQRTDDQEEEDDQESMPILVMSDQKIEMTFSSLVPKKGVHAYAIMRVCNDLSYLGHERIVIRPDGEPALRSLKEVVQTDPSMKIELSGRKCDKRDQIIKEESCAHDSRTNGYIESKIRRVQGQIRAMKDALESRLGCKIKDDHECLPWLIRHASFLRSRLVEGSSGMTPIQKMEGQRVQDTIG